MFCSVQLLLPDSAIHLVELQAITTATSTPSTPKQVVRASSGRMFFAGTARPGFADARCADSRPQCVWLPLGRAHNFSASMSSTARRARPNEELVRAEMAQPKSVRPRPKLVRRRTKKTRARVAGRPRPRAGCELFVLSGRWECVCSVFFCCCGSRWGGCMFK